MKVFTDGACAGNPGPGGWGWVTEGGRSAKGGEAQSTNQRMELQAVLEAIQTLEGPLHIHSDSTYVVKCFNDRWYEGWLKRGWKNSAKKPVANRDIWEPLIEAYLARADELTFTWVKGHAGNELNEIADQLAVAARDEQSAAIATANTSGGGADDAAPSIDAPWPLARSVWLVGATTLDDDGVSAVRRAVEGLDPTNDVLVSGLRRGAELVGAERALELGIALAVVLPFSEPAAGWPPADRARFERAIDRAAHVVTLEGNRAKPGDAVEQRNEWMSGTVLGAIVVDDASLESWLDDRGLSVRVVTSA